MGPERETITTSPPTGQNVANCAANYTRNGSYPTEECKQFVVAEPVVSDANCENDRRYDTAEPINSICKIGQHLQDRGRPCCASQYSSAREVQVEEFLTKFANEVALLLAR